MHHGFEILMGNTMLKGNYLNKAAYNVAGIREVALYRGHMKVIAECSPENSLDALLVRPGFIALIGLEFDLSFCPTFEASFL
jgi:hypothetical protein